MNWKGLFNKPKRLTDKGMRLACIPPVVKDGVPSAQLSFEEVHYINCGLVKTMLFLLFCEGEPLIISCLWIYES